MTPPIQKFSATGSFFLICVIAVLKLTQVNCGVFLQKQASDDGGLGISPYSNNVQTSDVYPIVVPRDTSYWMDNPLLQGRERERERDRISDDGFGLPLPRNVVILSANPNSHEPRPQQQALTKAAREWGMKRVHDSPKRLILFRQCFFNPISCF